MSQVHPRETLRLAWPWLLVTLAAVLPYLGVLHGEFVFGDVEFIIDNPVMRSDALLRDAFAHSYWYVSSGADHAPYYRPIVVLLDGLNYAWFGQDPFGYHVTNVLIHVAVSWSVLWLGRLLLDAERSALLAAMLFAAHPVHVHSVAYISGRTSSLSTLWLVLSLCALAAAAERAKEGQASWAQQGGALLFAALAFFTKESSALLPLLAAGALLLRAEHRPETLRRHGLLLGALCALLLVYLVARGLVLEQLGSTRKPLWYRLDAFSALLTMAKIVGYYPSKLLFPSGLSYLPPFVPALSAADAWGLFWLVALSAAAVWVFYPAPERRAPRYWTFWFLATLAPVSGIVSLEYFVKEHHAYLPAVGFCMLLGLLAERGLVHLEQRRAAAGRALGGALFALCVLSLGIATASHAQSFAGPEAAYRRVIELEPEIPDAAFAHPAMNKSAHRFAVIRMNLALLQLKQERCDLALPNLARASQLARSDELAFQVRFLHGDCSRRLGQLAQAKADFQHALTMNTRRAEPALQLALIAHAERNPAERARYLAIACERGAKQACQEAQRLGRGSR